MNTFFKRTSVRITLAIVLVFSGFTGYVAEGQSTTADILGTVTDASGAVVPDAAISVRNLDTGEVRNVITSKTGEYVVTALQVGNYSLTVEEAGFKKFDISAVTVAAGDRARIDAKLQPGTADQVVNVTTVPLLYKRTNHPQVIS